MGASVTVLGGAGFIGSRVVERCVAAGLQTTVIDGMLPKTGARPANLNACRSSINLETRRIEHAENLSDVLRSSDAIVDCMGWTCHRSAALDPLYDLELNVQSHVAWLSRVPPRREQRVIYLGSRVQYGRVDGVIDESTPMRPVDVQGVHKLAAEHHFQLSAERRGCTVVSLRLPNCAGRNQPVEGPDIGLVAGFFRDALRGRPIQVYGGDRRRPIVGAGDIAELVARLIDASIEGFQAYNVPAHDVAVEWLAEQIAKRAGNTIVMRAEMPLEIRHMEPGVSRFDTAKIAAVLPEFRLQPLDELLDESFRYFGERLNDLAM